MLELRQIRKHYALGPLRIEVLAGVDLSVARGEMIAIRGPSGSGKTTLMNIVGLLDSPAEGGYRYDGRDVLAAGDRELARLRNREIGFVFQQYCLLPRLTARENVCLPLLYRPDADPRATRARADELLERVGLSHRADHFPGQLSGGQAQRVAIARALIGRPRLLLADEPTGSLDTRVTQEIVDLFHSLNRDDGITIVIVTHNEQVSSQCARRWNLEAGQTFAA